MCAEFYIGNTIYSKTWGVKGVKRSHRYEEVKRGKNSGWKDNWDKFKQKGKKGPRCKLIKSYSQIQIFFVNYQTPRGHFVTADRGCHQTSEKWVISNQHIKTYSLGEQIPFCTITCQQKPIIWIFQNDSGQFLVFFFKNGTQAYEELGGLSQKPHLARREIGCHH